MFSWHQCWLDDEQIPACKLTAVIIPIGSFLRNPARIEYYSGKNKKMTTLAETNDF